MNPSLLVAWLVTAMLGWTSGRGHTPERQAELDGLAREILTVVYEHDETPLFGGASPRAHSALFLASVASQESGLDARVQRGECNAWEGKCDGGRAACYMQIHATSGIVLTPDEWVYARDVGERPLTWMPFTADDLRASPMVCFTTGMHMLRRALRQSHGRNICGYTGEHGVCSKGAYRQRLADDYFLVHAPPVSDDEIEAAAQSLALR